MPDKAKWDISNENFDHFFHKLSAVMTEPQREILPKDLYFKLFKRGGEYNTKDTTKLLFLAKAYILIKSLKKRMVIMFEDEKEGMDEEQYFKYKKLLSKRKFSISAASDLVEDAVFVLGNKELMDTYSSLNDLSVSPAYNYLIKGKNPSPGKVEQRNKEMNYIINFLVRYESSRKKIAMNSGINFNEFLVLMALYHGEEMQGSRIYKEIYKHSFNSSANKKKLAFRTLEMSGYIEKFGKTNNMKLRITPLGRDKVINLLNIYVLSH